jgi:hypothetical protein
MSGGCYGLTKTQIQLLVDNGWEIECESPLEFGCNRQFSGGYLHLDTYEDAKEVIKGIENSADFKKKMTAASKAKWDVHQKRDDRYLMKSVENICLNGVTAETLLAFHRQCLKHKHTTGDRLKKLYHQAFDNVDPFLEGEL